MNIILRLPVNDLSLLKHFTVISVFSKTSNQSPGLPKNFTLSSEHVLLNAGKYNNIKKISFFHAQKSL